MSFDQPNTNTGPAADINRALSCVILAAGKGTRMESELPKVMHQAFGRPLVKWVVDAARDETVGADSVVLVVGFGREQLEAAFAPQPNWLHFALQAEQLGTGHAIDQARAFFSDEDARKNTDILVLCGDGPLIRAETLNALRQRHQSTGAAATLATATLEDATGYGRIVRNAAGNFDRIVEQKDATDDQRLINEINPSYYIFRADALFDTLPRLSNSNANGEYYITDLFELLRADGERIEVLNAVPAEDVLSVNTLDQLATVDSVLRQRASTQLLETER